MYARIQKCLLDARVLSLHVFSVICVFRIPNAPAFPFHWSCPMPKRAVSQRIKRSHVTPQVSNKGRYKNCYGVISRPQPSTDGYVYITIRGERHQFHRVVARTWCIPGRSDQITVDHVDNNKSNNQPEQIQKSHDTNLGPQIERPQTFKTCNGKASRQRRSGVG